MRCVRLVPIVLGAAALALLGGGLRGGDGTATAGEREKDARRVVARVDPRVELLSIVFRLAGNPEYRKCRVDEYTRALDGHFAKHADHAVVRRAAALRRQHGVSFDAVMGLAVHLDEDLKLAVPIDGTERLDRRWPREDLKPFLDELRAFSKESDAPGFFRSQRPLYELTEKRMQAVLDEKVRFAWFDTFFGARPTARFELTLGLVNGPCNYGPSVLRAGGREDLWCVLGVWTTDAEGKPAFGEDVVPTVVHEFCHSYCNALVDAHLDGLSGPAQSLWPQVAEAMARQAYGDWKIMMRESLVRACVVRYQAAAGGAVAAEKEIAEQHSRSFAWTGGLAEVLAGYERDRKAYPTLDRYMPKVASFFADYARGASDLAARAPKVVSMEPANGAKDVDPSLRSLRITFDRPMRDGAWAVVGGGDHFPKITGKPSYDAARKVLTVPVELKPSWDYELWLNRGKFDSFASEDGVKLASVHVTFRTREK